MLPIIQSLWIGSDLSQVEKLCAKSFLDHGHEFHLYTYGDIEEIPHGTIIKDANEILPQSEIFKNKRGGFANSVIGFASHYCIRKATFGWIWMWFASNRFPLTRISYLPWGRVEQWLAVQSSRCQKGHILAESMEKAIRHHTEPFPWESRATRDKKLKRRLFRRGKEGMEFDNPASPGAPTNAIHYLGAKRHAKPYMYFYPVDFTRWMNVFNRSVRVHYI